MSEIHSQLLSCTRNIICSFVANNFIECDKVPDLIQGVYGSLAGVLDVRASIVTPERQKPAVPIASSVAPDYIICLEDGRKFKSLRRHLRVKYSLTPDEYRTKWGLPDDYPIIAENYAAERSRIAKEFRPGRASIVPTR
ncbi:MucR family transcriptional regulator [Rhizobium multihospitium]|uniref:Transcriptional regulator, MucR family n=1 Tax=Rhizobium multihospitium TaxID=410764 RepID=A0A1C3VWC3_9HYPH|nr:MucR family transcriptional regulator [Rhizobium multihospitium]SCB32019.1 transcriptional regulator, MucR family [Rhizobium multihospitium]